MKKKKGPWQKTWDFVWNGESVLSFVVQLLLAFLIIKFMVYPLLGFFLGTKFPLVAVVSESMEHDQAFDQWWEDHKEFYAEYDITEDDFREYPLHNGFNKGDLILLVGFDDDDLKEGVIPVYWAGKPYPIIHRIVDIYETDETFFVTKGDNNPGIIINPPVINEKAVSPDQVIGKAAVRIPYLGYIKIFFSWITGIE